MDRDTKLIAILRRQYHIILTALGENIFHIGLRRVATPPNTEYIFSQLAVNIMWYCRLKSQLVYRNNDLQPVSRLFTWSKRYYKEGKKSY